MLTKAPIGRETLDNQQRGLAALVALAVLAGLTYLFQDAFGEVPRIELEATRTADVGVTLFRDFVLPFEVVSVLLLAALVGAVVVARKDEWPGQTGGGRDVGAQGSATRTPTGGGR
jgi:NADH-quinone oxidoreductase subunit J